MSRTAQNHYFPFWYPRVIVVCGATDSFTSDPSSTVLYVVPWISYIPRIKKDPWLPSYCTIGFSDVLVPELRPSDRSGLSLPTWLCRFGAPTTGGSWKKYRALALELELQAADSGFSDISWNRCRAGFEGPSRFWVDTHPFMFHFLSGSAFFSSPCCAEILIIIQLMEL